MRRFNDGDTITVEPWRSAGFPVIKDLMVDLSLIHIYRIPRKSARLLPGLPSWPANGLKRLICITASYAKMCIRDR